MTTLYAGPTTEQLAYIPTELTTREQWVLWRGEDRIDQQTGEVKLNKIPINPCGLTKADTTDPATWGAFVHCVDALPIALEEWEQADPSAYRGGGLGFVFASDDPYTGIDLDHCVDAATGMIDPAARQQIDTLASYTEITPSGTGLHIIVQGTLPLRGRKKGHVEMYNYARFFTMTGWHVPGTPRSIEARHEALTQFHSVIFGSAHARAQGSLAPSVLLTPMLDDAVILEKARAARHGAGSRFATLYEGDWTRYPSQSEADLALCIGLVFWTQDAAQIDRLFRQSLLMRDKWDEPRGDRLYGVLTIAEALARQTEHYTPRVQHLTDVPVIPSANGTVPHIPITLPHVPPPLAPALPSGARLEPRFADGAAPWLDAYCEHSRQWSPRSAQGFHQAVGLWMLSTLAARRICVEMGSPLYPVLFLAMVARSTLYAKTTTAKIGRDGLIASGCRCLLASDRSTPQALLRSMSGRVPADYGSLSEDDQQAVRQRVAFAAQRGWYFEEWGGMLQQMTRRDSPMAEFHGLLRVLDDGYQSFSTDTIQRGLEHVEAPYLSLLASATPHDLGKFMEPGSPWWHDGFWPRFALIVPLPEELPSLDQRPWGSARLPGRLIEPLHTWHTRLGIPDVTIDPAMDAKGKPTGEWRATRSPVPLRVLEPTPAVKDAYEAYNASLIQLLTNGDAPDDLDACYGRLHDKALRIAMLLASFAHQETIAISHWTYAQHVTETWRRMLHQTIEMVSAGQPLTREEQLENKVESLIARDGPRTARELHKYIRGYSSAELTRAVMALLDTERVVAYQDGKAKRYGLPMDQPQEKTEEGEQSDVPF